MKKLVILMIVLTFIVLVSIVRAYENGDEKVGRLLFFHKCDESLIGTSSPCRAVIAKMVPVFSYDDVDDDDDDGDGDDGDGDDGDGDDGGGDDGGGDD